MPYQGTVGGSVQSGYFDNFDEGFPGQIATLNDPRLVDGFPAEGNLAIGIGATRGIDLTLAVGKFNNHSAPNTVKTPLLGVVAADFQGITVRNSSNKNDINGVPLYEAKDMVSILRKGRIFVTANQAIAARDPVFWIINDTVTHGFQIGSFSNVALGALGVDTVALTDAKFWKAAPAGKSAIIELNTP